MSPAAVGPVKAMLRSLDLSAVESFLAGTETATSHSLRDRLRDFLTDHGVAA
jgi:phosphotransferase system enzyme I (PtsP)